MMMRDGCWSVSRAAIHCRSGDPSVTPPPRTPSGGDLEVNAMNAVTGAHLIGSVPLPDAETVFRSVARELGPYPRAHPGWRDRQTRTAGSGGSGKCC